MVAFGTFVASSLLLLSPSTYAQSSSSTDIVNTKKDHRKVEELVEEFEKAGLGIRYRAIKEYFHPDTLWTTGFVGAGTLLCFIAEAQ